MKPKSARIVKKPSAKPLEKFRRMATVIQDSNDAITFQDLDGNILAWNRGAEKIYGYSEAEALKMNIVDTVPKDYQEEARGFIASLKSGELVRNLETKRRTKDGRIIDMWLITTKLTDDKGKLTGIATTERDITERKQNEVSLLEKFSELDFLRRGQIALSESMRGEQMISRLGQRILSHLVPFLNAQLGVFYVVNLNKKLEQICTHALTMSDDSEVLIKFGEGLIGQVAADKKSIILKDVPLNYFKKIQSGLGGMLPKSLLICPVLFENEVVGVIELGSFHTFTEHQSAFLNHVSENIGIAINTSNNHKKVQELLEQLKKSVAIRDEFMSIASHELKTPITSLKLQAQLRMRALKRGDKTAFTPEKLAQLFDSDQKEFDQLTHLIDDILDISRINSGKLSMTLVRFDLCELVKSIVERSSELFVVADCPIELKLCPPVFGHWDRFRIEQVIMNLLTNAIRYGEKQPILLNMQISLNRVQIIVIDSGRGIAPENHHRIFERFERAVVGNEISGLGLGLYIVKQIVEAHHGSVRVESELNQGATFIVELPLDKNQELPHGT